MSSWILRRSRVGSETYIVGGTKDHQESTWFEPGSVLGRVQPHLHEHAGTRPQKPHLEQAGAFEVAFQRAHVGDRKSTRLNSSHQIISYAVFCLKKKKIRYCYSE